MSVNQYTRLDRPEDRQLVPWWRVTWRCAECGKPEAFEYQGSELELSEHLEHHVCAKCAQGKLDLKEIRFVEQTD